MGAESRKVYVDLESLAVAPSSGLTPTLDTISCSHTLDPWTREYKPGLMTDGISSLG
jgi:hypothetical protein